MKPFCRFQPWKSSRGGKLAVSFREGRFREVEISLWFSPWPSAHIPKVEPSMAGISEVFLDMNIFSAWLPNKKTWGTLWHFLVIFYLKWMLANKKLTKKISWRISTAVGRIIQHFFLEFFQWAKISPFRTLESWGWPAYRCSDCTMWPEDQCRVLPRAHAIPSFDSVNVALSELV